MCSFSANTMGRSRPESSPQGCSQENIFLASELHICTPSAPCFFSICFRQERRHKHKLLDTNKNEVPKQRFVLSAADGFQPGERSGSRWITQKSLD